jgi:hypothetical protein
LTAGFDLTLTGCEVSNNSAVSDGGGISNEGSTYITASRITGNTAHSGGGIASGYLKLVGCDVSHNKALYSYGYSSYGGGISAGDFVIDSSTITDNSAVTGAGIAGGGTGRISNSEIRDNTATGNGGGVFVGGASLTLDSSTISGNSAFNGGGIYAYGYRYESLTAAGCLISNNSAPGTGGGILAREFTALTNSTVCNNAAGGDGGGIYVGSLDAAGAGLSLTFCTVVDNQANYNSQATMAGGGLFLASGKGTLVDTIVASNRALLGPDLTGLIGTSFDAQYCLIGDNTTSGLAEAPLGSPDAKGNLIGGSLHGAIEPRLGPLANHGGATFTYSLQSISPAIDAGDPKAVAGSGGVPADDQRGASFTRVYGGRIDIGAVESQPTPAAYLGDFNGDGSVDAADYLVWRARLGSAVTPYTSADGDGSGVVDAADYQVWMGHFGEVLPGPGVGASGDGAQRVAAISTAGQASSGTLARVEDPHPLDNSRPLPEGEVGVAGSTGLADVGLQMGERSEVGPGGAVSLMATAPRPFLGAFGRATQGVSPAAIISRSEAATISRDDALLVWLAGNRGVRREALGGSIDAGRKAEGGWMKLDQLRISHVGLRIEDFQSAADEVFAGMARAI